MGSLVYPLSFPSVGHITTSRFGLRRKMAETESPFSGATQVHDYGYAKWVAQITLAPMKREHAAEWCAFLVNLRGRFGTFLMGDPDYYSPRGALGGSGSVLTASAPSGTTASITSNQIPFSYTGSLSGVDGLKSGDYISTGSGLTTRMYMVREDASISTGSGTANIEPYIKTFISNGSAIEYENPKALFRMDSDEAVWDTDQVSKYGFTFSCTEAY